LVYLVRSVTFRVVGDVLSVPLTVMLLPATDATVPLIRVPLPDGADGAPEGAGLLEPAGGSLSCGHLPSTAGLTRTDDAVMDCPPWDSPRAGRTLMQLPAVTSVSAAVVTSVTVVDGPKSTVVVPFSRVSWTALPDTDAISPLTRAWPLAGGDVAVVDGVAAGPVMAGAGVVGWGLAV
jgi:hypothetical protein